MSCPKSGPRRPYKYPDAVYGPQVLWHLDNEGAQHAWTLASKLGLPRPAVRKLLANLERRGAVQRVGVVEVFPPRGDGQGLILRKPVELVMWAKVEHKGSR